LPHIVRCTAGLGTTVTGPKWILQPIRPLDAGHPPGCPPLLRYARGQHSLWSHGAWWRGFRIGEPSRNRDAPALVSRRLPKRAV